MNIEKPEELLLLKKALICLNNQNQTVLNAYHNCYSPSLRPDTSAMVNEMALTEQLIKKLFAEDSDETCISD